MAKGRGPKPLPEKVLKYICQDCIEPFVTESQSQAEKHSARFHHNLRAEWIDK